MNILPFPGNTSVKRTEGMKQMRHRFTKQIAANIFLGAVALSSAIAIGALYADSDTKGAAADLSDSQVSITESPVFILREYEEKLALFRDSSASPAKIYDFDVTMLTEYDRNILREGITLYSQSEVDRLIEDLTS